MEFVVPPQSTRGRNHTKWVNIVTELKKVSPDSDRYGLVGEFSIGVATHIRKGKYPAFLPEHIKTGTDEAVQYMKDNWIVTTRSTEKGRNNVYIKWIGTDE